MGGRAGGAARGIGQRDNGKYETFEISNVESLKNMEDRALYNATKQAISRFYKEMGMPQRKVKLADFNDDSVAGVHRTKDGKTEGVYLNKKDFKKGTVESISKGLKSAYKNKLLTQTNKPVSHVVTHELAHSVWNAHMTGAKQKAAGKVIEGVFNQWKADKTKSGYGRYAGSNVSEFYAETITKGIHGNADAYTKQLKAITKKYKL